MLARTFKSAAELGIPEHEREALCTVLYMIEDGQIDLALLKMHSYTDTERCGTTHCLAGWAHAVDKTAFPELDSFFPTERLHNRLPLCLLDLFGIGKMGCYHSSKAPAKLRTYLETGKCP